MKQIDTIRAALEQAYKERHEPCSVELRIDESLDILAELERALKACGHYEIVTRLETDAARYLWLRDESGNDHHTPWCAVGYTDPTWLTGEHLDAAIDAARADARIAELERECSQWCEEVRIYSETENKRIAELERERNSLRDFANAVMESWPHGDVDGYDLERMAVEHGLLALKDPKPTEPCCDNCACSGYPSPEEWSDGIDCYVRTPLLKGDAARAGNGGVV